MDTAQSQPPRPVPWRTRSSNALAALAYLTAGLLTGAAGLAILIAGWTTTAVLAITPASVGALMVFAWLVNTWIRSERWLARRLLRVTFADKVAPPRTEGYWSRGRAILRDTAFWRGQAWMLIRIVLGWPVAILFLGLMSSALGAIAAPLYYRWIPQDTGDNGVSFGIWRVDTFAKSLALVPIGIGLLALVVVLLGLTRELWARLAVTVVDAEMSRMSVATRARRPPRRWLAMHVVATGFIVATLIMIWAATTRGYFWPLWPMLGLGTFLAVHAWIVTASHSASHAFLTRPRQVRGELTRGFAIHAGVSAIIVLSLTAIWAVTTTGYFWPIWPFLGLALIVGVHWLVIVTRRMDHLVAAREGAVEVQETDLRRIERDLHDGAQARLVSLGMNLGLAEQRFDHDPEGARALVREARHGVTEALGELRNLVRGIRPPVLADRGLAAAISAVVDRCPIPVEVAVRVEPRPSDTAETAAYFVVAECIANAAKHAGASRIAVRIERWNTTLRLEVLDDGCGGANPQGPGLSGLRRRVDAVDGTLSVSSPSGGPTVVRAEIPCGS